MSDVRLALRALRRQPGSSAIAVITLALAIGANTSIFSVADAIVYRPFPIPGVGRLVMLWQTNPAESVDRGGVAPANLIDWQMRVRSLERLVGIRSSTVNVSGGEVPEVVQGAEVSPGFFEMLGQRPFNGRFLSAADDVSGRDKVTVISHRLWIRRYRGDPRLVGETVLLDRQPFVVSGIAAPGFEFPEGTDVWMPLAFTPEEALVRDQRGLNVIGRLANGETVRVAESELAVIAGALAREYPEDNDGRGINVLPLSEGAQDEGAGAMLAIFQVTAGLVLIIACVNVATLLLARGLARQRELALRTALGADRWRIHRLLLTESLVLALAGGALSLPVAWLATEVIRAEMPARIARFVLGWEQIGIDARVVGLTVLASIVAAVAFGVLPAFRSSRPDLVDALKEGGRGGGAGRSSSRSQQVLVAVQMSVALAVIVAAGLAVRASMRLAVGPQGYDPDGLLTFRIDLSDLEYAGAARQRLFFEQLMTAVSALPAVERVAAADGLPSATGLASRAIEVEGSGVRRASAMPVVGSRVVTAGYLETMRIPILQGRDFEASDGPDGVPVAVVSRSMAARFWPGHDPIGRRFRIAGEPGAPWLHIVGVADDVLDDWFSARFAPTFYRPMPQAPRGRMSLVLRTGGDPAALAADVRQTVAALDADQPAYDMMTQRQVLSDRTVGLRYLAGIMGVMAVLALLLSAVGLYGVMSYAVGRRTRDIGVQLALGAGRAQILRSTLGSSVRLALAGVASGLVLAYVFGRVMASILFGIVAIEPGTFLLLTAFLIGVALIAAYVPARRAMAVDPMEALRAD